MSEDNAIIREFVNKGKNEEKINNEIQKMRDDGYYLDHTTGVGGSGSYHGSLWLVFKPIRDPYGDSSD